MDGLLGLVSRLGDSSDTERKERPKFVGYHDLLRVLEMPQCPVCFIVRRSLEGFLSVAFIQELTASEFRELLRRSLGYCRQHSEHVRTAARNKLTEMGIAIVYEDILALAQHHMQTRRTVPVVAHCPLCPIQQDVEAYAMQLIADYCNDREFQDHYETASGVCLIHYHGILKQLEGDARKFFHASHMRKLDIRLGQLREFIRKHDYRFANEKMTDQEATCWKSAVWFLAGD